MMRRTVVGILFFALLSTAAMAQAPAPNTQAPTATAPPPSPAATPAATPIPAAATVVKAPAKAGEKCMRLPLSDIAFGRDETIAQTRMRLGEYAEAERRKRGWGALTRSRETIECEVYLVLPVLGTEYKCLVTATYCTK